MSKSHYMWIALLTVFVGVITAITLLRASVARAQAQFPIMDKVANKVIQKFQQSSCDQLLKQKSQQQNQPKSPAEEEALKILRNDPQIRTEFINKVAAPIVNKLFECGMIP